MSQRSESARAARASDWELHAGRFAFNPATGHFFLLSPEGAEAFRLILGGASIDAVAQRLCAKFGIDPQTGLRDAGQFAAQLAAMRLADAGAAARTGKA